MPLIGLFVIESLSDKNICVLKEGDRILKTKHIKNSTNAAKEFVLINL